MVGGVGVEVFFWQVYFCQVFVGCIVGQDCIGWGQMVGGDVVVQYCQWMYVMQWMFVGQCVFLVWWMVDVGVLWMLVIQWVDWCVVFYFEGEYWVVDLVELFWFDVGGYDCVDFGIVGLQVFQCDWVVIGVMVECIFFNVEVYSVGNGVGYYQWW